MGNGGGSLPRGIVFHRGCCRVRLTVEGITDSLGVFDALRDAKAALAIAQGRERGDLRTAVVCAPSGRQRPIESRLSRSFSWAEPWLVDLGPTRSGRGRRW